MRSKKYFARAVFPSGRPPFFLVAGFPHFRLRFDVSRAVRQVFLFLIGQRTYSECLNFQGESFLPLFAAPALASQSAFDIYRTAFVETLLTSFCHTIP